MLTQWRRGWGSELDYNVLPFIFRVRKVSEGKEEEVFEGLKIMEEAAIKAIRERG